VPNIIDQRIPEVDEICLVFVHSEVLKRCEKSSSSRGASKSRSFEYDSAEIHNFIYDAINWRR